MAIDQSSMKEKDIAFHFHPFTNPSIHEVHGPQVIERGDGIYLIDSDGNIKLIDFGFAKNLEKLRTYSMVGTEAYMSPEIIMGKNKGYSFEADWWAFGVLLY